MTARPELRHANAQFVADRLLVGGDLDLFDTGKRVPAAWFEAEVGRVLAWFEEPDAVVLTHCHMGVNRGPSLGFAVLLGLGLEPVEALQAIQAARPIAYAYYAE